jgi:hypothetical protein
MQARTDYADVSGRHFTPGGNRFFWRGAARASGTARKHFFFEKKKQRTFIRCSPLPVQQCDLEAARKQTKVFWCFFSKKNCFLAFAC